MERLSFDQLVSKEDSRTDDVETPRGLVTLGSVSSADILEWFDENDDPIKKKLAGLRLLVKSFINPDGTRIPLADREAAVKKLTARDAKENGLLVVKALELNGLRAKQQQETGGKNVPGEAVPTDASPIDSPAN